MTHTQLLSSIKQRKIAPVYLLVGEETFQRDEALDTLIKAVVDPAGRDFNLHVFYADEADPAEIANVAASYPLFAEKRMVVVKRAEKLTEVALDTILPSIRPPNDTTCLIFVASGVDLRRKGWGQVKALAEVIEYKQIYNSKIPEWIERYVGERGGRISREAAKLLGEVTGNNLRELSAEIGKLLLITENGVISVGDVEQYIGTSPTGTIFTLADIVAGRNLRKASHLLDDLLSRGETGVGIVAALARHFTILLRLKYIVKHPSRMNRVDSERLAKQMGLSPYFIDKYIAQLTTFSEETLKNAITALLAADNHLKGGYQTERMVVDLLIWKLCRTENGKVVTYGTGD